MNALIYIVLVVTIVLAGINTVALTALVSPVTPVPYALPIVFGSLLPPEAALIIC
jgi:hypothetical protein